MKEYNCKYCGETNPKKFAKKSRSSCRLCENRILQKKKKQFAVDYKGGKCQNCGYDKYIGALEFHHLDSNEKDSKFNKFKTWSYERIKKELDKCIMLCSNCHKEKHEEIRQKSIDNKAS